MAPGVSTAVQMALAWPGWLWRPEGRHDGFCAVGHQEVGV